MIYIYMYHEDVPEASGSSFLRARLEILKPDVHVFGHTHFGWDSVLDGTRYVQAALGYPHERKMRRCNAMQCHAMPVAILSC